MDANAVQKLLELAEASIAADGNEEITSCICFKSELAIFQELGAKRLAALCKRVVALQAIINGAIDNFLSNTSDYDDGEEGEVFKDGTLELLRSSWINQNRKGGTND